MLLRAAAIKAGHAVPVAGAWIAASAEMIGATLVHKDPKFAPLPIRQELLPMKARASGAAGPRER